LHSVPGTRIQEQNAQETPKNKDPETRIQEQSVEGQKLSESTDKLEEALVAAKVPFSVFRKH
jgi:hypothetical protein